MRIMPIGLAAAWALILSGCASLGRPGEADARKLTWFSYVNGEVCGPSAPATSRTGIG